MAQATWFSGDRMRQETHVAKQPACPVNGNKEDRSSYVFRGRTLGEMLHSPNGGKAVTWRPLDNMLIKAFLAHGEHDYSSIKTADLTRLARYMDIDVDGLADAEWAVIAKKIQSSLHYWLDKTVRVGELQVYFDAQEKRNRLKWPAALKKTWNDGVAVMRREGEQRLEDLPVTPPPPLPPSPSPPSTPSSRSSHPTPPETRRQRQQQPRQSETTRQASNRRPQDRRPVCESPLPSPSTPPLTSSTPSPRRLLRSPSPHAPHTRQHCPRTPDNAVPLFRPIDWDSTPVSLGTTSKYSPIAVVASPASVTVPLNRVAKGPWGIIPRLRSETPYPSRPAKQQPGLFQVPIDNDALVAPRALDKTEQALVDMFTTNQRAQDDKVSAYVSHLTECSQLVRRAFAFPARDSSRKYYVAILKSLFDAQDPPTRVWHAVTEILERSALDDDAAEERLRPLRARERRLQAALKLSGATSSELRAMVRAMTDRHRDERRMHLDSLLWWLGSTAGDEEAS